MTAGHIVRPRVFVRNLFSSWGALLVEVVVAFFLTPFIIGTLGAVVYGVWSLINSLVGYLGLVDMGVRGGVGRFINHYLARQADEAVNQVINTSLGFLSMMSLLVLGIAYWIAQYFAVLFPKTPEELLPVMVMVLPLMVLNLWLAFALSIFRSVLEAKDRFEVSNAINVFVIAIRTVGVIFVLTRGYGLLGLVYAVVASNAAGTVAFLWAAKRIYRPLGLSARHVSRDRWSELWRFGLAGFVTRSAHQLIYQSDQIIVMIFFGPAMVAVYSVATMLIQYGQRLVEQIGGALFPSIIKSGSLDDLQGLRTLYVGYARLAFYFSSLLYIGMIVFGGDFIRLWVGEDFAPAALVLAILCGAELLALLSSTGGSTLFSLGRVRFNVVSASVEALANIVITVAIVGILQTDIAGVAIGTLIAAALVRGLWHPMYTTGRIGLRLVDYLLGIGGRAVVLAAVTWLIFVAIAGVSDHIGWYDLMGEVAVATAVYLVVGALIMFPLADLKKYNKSIAAAMRR